MPYLMNATAVEPKVTSEGRLFYCPTLNEWFSIEEIDADPRLSLMGDETVTVSENTEENLRPMTGQCLR